MSSLASMFVVARHQARVALAGRRGLFFTSFWVLLVALAVWAGGGAAKGERHDHATTIQAGRQAYAEWLRAYGDESWRPVFLVAEHPLVLHKPPAPARALAGGVDEMTGAWAQPAGYYVRELEGRRAELSPLGSLLGGLDLTGLVMVAGALAAIALGYDAISGEKERGTLALHFATPLRRDTFILGKALGSLGALLMALGVPLLLGVGALFAWEALPLTLGTVLRAGGFLTAAVAYLAFWCMLAVAASAWAKNSATSFVALAAVWLVLALALPKVAAIAAARAVPVPAPVQIEQRMSKALDESKAHYKRLVNAHREQHGRRPNEVETARLKLAYYDHHFRAVDAIAGAYEEAMTRRAWLFQLVASISPAYGFHRLASDLAGTEGNRYRRFIKATNGYLRALRYEAERRLLRGQANAPGIDELPAFTFMDPRSISLWPRWLSGITALLLAVAMAYLGALAAFRRYDLRVHGG